MQLQQKNVSPKLKKFLEDLNELTEHYQYMLKAILSVTQDGIVPKVTVADRVPDKPKSKKFKLSKKEMNNIKKKAKKKGK